ncbi:MAG: CHAT domain-containing protein [Rivularia sp. (in: Bacteria)]|nr:CHAT domain-containing protein [Rivularia sp. MS3]
MRYRRITFSLLTIFTLISTPVISSLEMPLGGLTAWGQTVDSKKAEANRLLLQGLEQLNTSQFEAALQSFEKARIIYREINLRQGEGNALGNIGLTYFYRGDYRKAIDYFEQDLAIAREIKDPQGEGEALGNIGIAYLQLGDYRKAIEYQQQHLAIARKIKDRQGEGNALGNIGNAYIKLGEYTKGIDYLEQVLAIARKIKNRNSEGAALGNIGSVYLDLGDYAKAIDYLEQYLAIAREIKNRNSEGIVLGNLGGAYVYLGDYAKGIDYLEQYLAIAREIKNRNSEGIALGNLGGAYIYLGDYAKGIDYQQQALAIARETKDPESEANALGNLGGAYLRMGDYPKAIDYQQQWLAIAREIKYRKSEGNALNNLGVIFYKSGNLSAAETILFDGINVLESLRGGLNDANKVSIFDTQSNTYRTLQQVLIAQNKTDTALEIAERGKARAFVELLASRLKLQQKPPAAKLEEIKQIAKAQNATLVQYSIIHDDFKIAGQQQLKESEIYIWVIKPTGEVTFRKADLKPLWEKENTTLAELVSNSRAQIGVRSRAAGGLISSYNPKKANNRFKQLHSLLIKPIENLLPKNPDERVIFVPQSSLFLVPFPALQDESGKYLIEKHTILTAPSIQVLDLTRKQRNRVSQIHQESVKQDILIVGNPTMPSVSPEIGKPPKKLPNLPGAENEAKAIAKLFNTKPLIGKDATETTIRQRFSEAKIIHLATHGLLDDFKDGSVPGAIALAPNGKDNGLLTANEIFDLQINADLVVLSACDTGQGKLTGDGVIGLSRSLISAGAPSVVVTLWTIPDNPTAMLMTEFYRQLQQNPDKARALRQAMLTTMKKHQNPRDWAAFTLIGEAK